MRTVKFKCVKCGHIREIKFKNIRLIPCKGGYGVNFDGISYEGNSTTGYVDAVCPNKTCVRYDIKAKFIIPEGERSNLLAVLV